jgi:hypothetical protein
MPDCHDYIWDSSKNQFICNIPTSSYHLREILLAIILLFVIFSTIVVIIELARIIRLVRSLLPAPTKFKISQVEKGKHMAITGIPLGGTKNFAAVNEPAGSVLPAGVIPQWSCSDSSATLTPSADGTNCNVSVPANDTNTSLTLTVTATLPVGTTPTSGPVTIPILPPEPTAFTINQTN